MTNSESVNLYTRLYAESTYGMNNGTRGRMQLIRNFMTKHAPAPAGLLEVGCGRGEFASSMAAAGYDVTATEIDKSIASALSPSCALAIAFLPVLPFDDGEFDVVVCSDVLEHLADDDEAESSLAELARVTSRLLLVSAAIHATTAAKYLPGDTTPLHLVRHPFDWWRARFEKHCVIIESTNMGTSYLFGEKKCQT